MKDKIKVTAIDSSSRTKLSTGCPVPESGIYRVLHAQHRLPQEVTLLARQDFPRCSRCSEPVFYELVRSAPAGMSSHGSAFNVMLYELPELLPDKEIAS